MGERICALFRICQHLNTYPDRRSFGNWNSEPDKSSRHLFARRFQYVKTSIFEYNLLRVHYIVVKNPQSVFDSGVVLITVYIIYSTSEYLNESSQQA